MKYLFFLSSMIINLLTYAQNTSIEKFTNDIFSAIVKNHYPSFDIFTVKKEDYAELNAKQNFKDDNARKNALKNMNTLIEEHQKNMKAKFEKIQNNAKNAGIQWAECKYLGYKVINKIPLKNGFKYDIAIQFTFKNVGEYEIHLNDCYELKKGWVVWKAIGGPW